MRKTISRGSAIHPHKLNTGDPPFRRIKTRQNERRRRTLERREEF
jgi:hypothetical protein